jgi:heat shock protein
LLIFSDGTINIIFYLSFSGQWLVNDVKPSPTGEAQEVKVKVRINHNGIVLISSAQMVERKEVQEAAETNGNEGEQNQQTEAPQSPTTEGAPPQAQSPGGEPMDVQEVS